jgi:hypothetical protein
MVDLPQLGCAYPRCPSPEASNLVTVAGRVRMCRSCGRLMVACSKKSCQALGTYNRPFVRRCRRCGEKVDQAAAWEEARQEGWKLDPGSVSRPEVIEDLSRLVDTSASGRYSIAIAMIRGVLAVHHAGHFLALVKAVPGESRGARPWAEERDPLPRPPDGSDQVAYTPVLLPDERHLLYSSPQGLLALDLWSCHELSAKDNNPKYRSVRCARRSIVALPIPLGNDQIGLLTRGRSRTDDRHFRWAVWDLSAPPENDAEFSARLDSEDLKLLPLLGKSCLCEEVDGRVITFSTGREHHVWQREAAALSDVDAIKRTWPGDGTGGGTSRVLDIGKKYLASTGLPRQAFLVQRAGVERFTWYFCVEQDDTTNPESLERYDVEFDSLKASWAQPIGLPSGASPIGTAPDENGILRMFFRAGKDIWFENDGPTARPFHHGLPQAILTLSASGPLAVSVGEVGQEGQSIGVHSLHHRGAQSDVPIEKGYRLVSRPLLWFQWLYTIELDPDNRLLLHRRTVSLEDRKVR